ncbi:MAG TPA: 50S ribosomal protein L22 [Candidatus Saccharimonadales bacterium]|nr:50S ribosomal protein L22 [Candidatus Saccharimonadales bacterium]
MVSAEGKNLRISTRKVRLVAKTLSGKNATSTLEVLKFQPKKAGSVISKVLKSAIANATNNNKLDEKKLIIKEVVVNEGQYLKRFRPRSRGMAHPIIKKSTHVKVVLEDKG